MILRADYTIAEGKYRELKRLANENNGLKTLLAECHLEVEVLQVELAK